MTRESIAELNAIDPSVAKSPGSFAAAAASSHEAQKLGAALITISRKLCRVAPECGTGFPPRRILFASARQDGRGAQDFCSPVRAILREEPIYYYNMGCYEALLGNPDKARHHLKISFDMDASFRALAKKDPDLASIQPVT